ANREKLRARTAILQDKAEWERQGQRNDLLLSSGFQLERALDLRGNPGDIPIDDIEEFILLSEQRETARQEIERRQREAELEREKARIAAVQAAQEKTARTQQRFLITLGIAAGLVFIVGAVAWALLANRKQQLDFAQANIFAELSRT